MAGNVLGGFLILCLHRSMFFAVDLTRIPFVIVVCVGITWYYPFLACPGRWSGILAFLHLDFVGFYMIFPLSLIEKSRGS